MLPDNKEPQLPPLDAGPGRLSAGGGESSCFGCRRNKTGAAAGSSSTAEIKEGFSCAFTMTVRAAKSIK